MKKKIHILGPSGSGTTTLGKILAKHLMIPFFDTDDIYWEESESPYSVAKPWDTRKSLLSKVTDDHSSWIISGSAIYWGDILLDRSDLIVLLYCDEDTRIERLKKREAEEFGKMIHPGGDMYENHIGFLEWARQYDTGGMDMRSKASEEAWVERAACPVIRLSNDDIPTSFETVMQHL